ncbi:transcription factor Jun [Rhipicephalus sanguineus]|nr:transcription factor Jun [Rhipicephalus sanguineus]
MRSMTLDLENAGLPELSRKRARSSSPLTTPDPDKLQLTSPEVEELVTDLFAPKTPPSPTTLFSRTEEREQYASGYSNGLPHVQLQQQEQKNQPPEPALQQLVMSGPNISDSVVPVSNPGFSLPSTSKHSATGDDVKDTPQMVPAMGATPPPWSIGSDEERIGKGSAPPPTTMHQAPQQLLPKFEEVSSRKCTMTLDLDNALSHPHNSKRARMLPTVHLQGAEPPLSLIDMRDRQRTKLDEKGYRNRIAQARRRHRQMDLWLQVKVNALKVCRACSGSR